MTRNELKELWFTIPQECKTTNNTILVDLNSGKVKIVSDGNNYHSFSTDQGDNALQYALKQSKLEEYKEYKLVIK
jgi:hypothetical protein